MTIAFRNFRARSIFPLLLLVLACCQPTLATEPLETGFQTPPHDSGIRAFWWWLNGNVTKDSITRDLEEMKAKGFNGALIFDADGSSQRGNQRVPAGPLFAGSEWTELFVHSCKEAKRLDLELSLNIQSGWNLGGPNVTPEEATQTLVWSKSEFESASTIRQRLPLPKAREFYDDVAVLAVPISSSTNRTGSTGETVSYELNASSTQSGYPASLAMDQEPESFWVSKHAPTPNNPQSLTIKLSKAVPLSELALKGRKGYGPRKMVIEVSADNQNYRIVKKYSLKDDEWLQAKFDSQKVVAIRLLFLDAHDSRPINGNARNVQVAEIRLPELGLLSNPRMHPIVDLDLKDATRELGISAPDCRFLLNTKPASFGEVAIAQSDIIDLTANLSDDGTLRCYLPEGPDRWVVLRFGHTNTNAHVSTMSAGWEGRVLNYLNPASLDAYWDRNIAPLMKAIGPLAGSTLRYIHTDSWEGGGMNWTPGLDDRFVKNHGYDLTTWLPVLAGYVVESREDSNAFLADFRKTIGDLVANHYDHLAKLASRHGMGTHPECSGPHAGPLDGLKNYGRSELMMSEFWSPSPHRPKPKDRFFVKQASSAAHIYGQRLVGAEGFTTIGPHWNDVPWKSMKPSFDHEICDGLNLLFNHTFTASPKAMGLPGQEYFAGTHFNPQVTWWNESTALIDYFRRCQFLAQQGDFVADVVYYYGDHIPNIAVRKDADPAGALPDFDYDVLSEELLLSSMTIENNRVVLPSGMQYRVLVLPDHRVLSLAAIKKIGRLVRDGATVLGMKPLRMVSLEGGSEATAMFKKLANGLWGDADEPAHPKGTRNIGKGRVSWGMSAREFLLADGVQSDVAFGDPSSASSLNWIHYRIDDADVYFVCESDGKEVNIDAIFRSSGRAPELWDAVDGTVRDAASFQQVNGGTLIPLEFDPYDSVFVVFREPGPASRNDGSNFPQWQSAQNIDGPWIVSFDDQWGGPSEPVRFDSLTDWIDHDDERIKYYSGKAVYRTSFEFRSQSVNKPLALELGQVKDVGMARVKLNGKDLGVVWRPPFRVDVTDAIETGDNRLEVTVVNSWRNRLIGDRDLPEAKRLTQTNIKITDAWKLESSGLLGPVVIVVDRNP